MEKVGILTLYTNNYNYGGILQSYALCKTINDMEKECKVIAYSGNRNIVYKSIKDRIKQYNLNEIIEKIKERIVEKSFGSKIELTISKRKKLFDMFCEKYIPHTKEYADLNINELNNEFDYFVSGSDQVWNPNCALGIFLQDFVDESGKKISYAASISRNDLSEHERSIMIPLIQDFKSISVREVTGKKLLEKYGIKNVSVVIDPTMLLTTDKWNNVIDDPVEKEPYVFCYFFSDSKEYRAKINSFCNKKGLKLLFIPYAKQKYRINDSIGKGLFVNEVGPSQFLGLIKNAEYVFTDSFHGLVFSILFNKKFIVFERDKNSNSTSKNSRIYDLLKLVSLEKRLIYENTDFRDIIDEDINYEKIESILNNERQKALLFLKESLK